MINYTLEQIDKAFSEIPQIMEKASFSVEVEGEKINISKKYISDESLQKSIYLYLTYVEIGLMPVEELEKNIKDDLNIENEIGKKITEEIKSLIDKVKQKVIFLEKRESIVNNSETEEDSSAEEKGQELLMNLTQKYKLQINQIGEIENETKRFLNGEMLSSDYEKKISSITKLAEPDFSFLLKDLNEIILKKKKGGEEGEDVPVPPYRKSVTEKESSELDQQEISEEIKKIQSNNYREPISEEDKLSESEHDIYKNSGIEMLKEKLGNIKMSEQNENDYSLPKIENTNTEINSNLKQSLNHDPYREEI